MVYMVDEHDPDEILTKAEAERKKSIEDAQQALTFFLEDVDGLIEWDSAESELTDRFDLSRAEAGKTLAQLVGDIVDPVQQVGTTEDRYVGVINFSTYSDAGAYGYTHYSDSHGKRNRVVCAKCVEEKDSDSEVAHATQGERTNHEDATWKQLLNTVTSHYADAHDSAPAEIDVGASLLSGTTMGGNQAWHQGNVTGGSNINIGTQDISINQGLGSGLDADTVDGAQPSELGGSLLQRGPFGIPSQNRRSRVFAITDTSANTTTDTFPNNPNGFVTTATARFSPNDLGVSRDVNRVNLGIDMYDDFATRTATMRGIGRIYQQGQLLTQDTITEQNFFVGVDTDFSNTIIDRFDNFTFEATIEILGGDGAPAFEFFIGIDNEFTNSFPLGYNLSYSPALLGVTSENGAIDSVKSGKLNGNQRPKSFITSLTGNDDVTFRIDAVNGTNNRVTIVAQEGYYQ